MNRSRREFLKTTCIAVSFVSLLGFAGRAFAKTKRVIPVWNGIVGDCVVTCPGCNKKVGEKMSSESVKRVFHCPSCLAWLSPKKGDHCIYDSYGSVKCPAMQLKARKAQNLPI
jgi:hypothetical protein